MLMRGNQLVLERRTKLSQYGDGLNCSAAGKSLISGKHTAGGRQEGGMDGRIKDRRKSGKYDKSLPSLFNPSLPLLRTCRSCRLFSGFPAWLLVVWVCGCVGGCGCGCGCRGDERKTAGMKRSKRAEIKKKGR